MPPSRAAAVRVIGRATADRSLLATALTDVDSRVRRAATGALAHHRRAPWSAELLADAARHDPEATVRAAALRALGRLADNARLLETVRLGLEPSRPLAVRLAAIDTAARLEPAEAAELLLLERLDSGEPAERLRAAAHLAAAGHEIGLAFLRNALRDEAVSTASGAAIAALRVGEPLRPALIEAIERPEPEVVLHVARALAAAGATELALTALRELVSRRDRIGLRAALALARQEAVTDESDRLLVELLDEGDEELRLTIARSSGSLDPLGLTLAIAALDDESTMVRTAAAASLLWSMRRWYAR